MSLCINNTQNTNSAACDFASMESPTGSKPYIICSTLHKLEIFNETAWMILTLLAVKNNLAIAIYSSVSSHQ